MQPNKLKPRVIDVARMVREREIEEHAQRRAAAKRDDPWRREFELAKRAQRAS